MLPVGDNRWLVKDLLKLRLLLNDEPVFYKNLFEIWCGRIEGGVRVCGIVLFLVRCCSNFYFKVLYCGVQSPSSVR